MVKFGGHVEAVRTADNRGTELYLVPYNDIKSLISATTNEAHSETHSFEVAWNDALTKSIEDFQAARNKLWNHVFSVVAEKNHPDSFRGTNPGNALRLYVDSVHPDKAQGLLLRMTQIHRAASINSEALRKLVKKHDKKLSDRLSLSLLPLLYASSLYGCQSTIQDGIGLVRELLDINAASDDHNVMFRNDSDAHHAAAVELIFEEHDWLKRLAESIPQHDFLPRLVAHRGFHNIKDRNDKRPLENSLSAYETAWVAGIQLCECDIALTKDEKLVLAHDENFLRLALDPNATQYKKCVSDLTFRELISMPLRNGIRPPLLIDVLRSACAISDKSQLIIEIKPGNEAAASALARLLLRHPDLRHSVATIMSFDAVTMHRLRNELSILEVDPTMPRVGSSRMGLHHRVTSFDHFGTMNGLLSSPRVHSSSDFVRGGGIGLSLSQAHLEPSSPELATETIMSKPKDMPKLMLLTVADPPKRPCENRVSVGDLSPVDQWLKSEEGELDGVYLQFEKSMMTPEGAEKLAQYADRKQVGIWGHSGVDPDDYKTFEWLVRRGNCSFVNTDLPNNFKKEVSVRSGSRSPDYDR